MNSTPAVERLVLILIVIVIALALLANVQPVASKIKERLITATKPAKVTL